MCKMINQLLMKLGIGDGSLNADAESRRKHIRHTGLQAEVEVANRAYSVRDWSFGGVSFDTLPDARLNEGDRINFTIRFRFPHETVTVQQQGRVVRARKQGVAAEFAPLSQDSRRLFERVIDSYNAQGFLESQVA